MKNPIIRIQYDVTTGEAIGYGQYIGRDETLKQWEYAGTLEGAMREVQRMQNAGYEFQHVKETSFTGKHVREVKQG